MALVLSGASVLCHHIVNSLQTDTKEGHAVSHADQVSWKPLLYTGAGILHLKESIWDFEVGGSGDLNGGSYCLESKGCGCVPKKIHIGKWPHN